MQENNFEKQVKQLMDELRITPSEPVWEYVEKRIPKSNRRRRFIAFFLLFIGLATCGYFFYNKDSIVGNAATNNNATEAIKKEDQLSNKQTEDAAKTEQHVSKDNYSNENNNHSATTTEIKQKVALQSGEANKIKNNTKEFDDKSTVKKEEKKYKEDSKEQIAIADETVNKHNIANNKEDNKEQIAINDKSSKKELAISNEIKQYETIITENKTDSIATITKTTADTTAVTVLKTNDAATQKKDLKKSNNSYKKLQWGISGFYGRSDMIEGISIFNSDKSLAGNLSANPGTNWDSAASVSYSKDVKAKAAFALGFIIKKQISKRSSISAGVQYAHITTQIRTGELKDTTANFSYNNSNITTNLNSYYRPGLSVSRTNKYNLVQIPLLYSYQFNRSKNLPLFVDAGFSLTRIISSDALVYDSYNQAYYKNPNLFNKTQITFTGGLHTNLSFIHNGTLEIGPQLQYGLTNVIRNTDVKQHLFMWGLNARYFIKRKK